MSDANPLDELLRRPDPPPVTMINTLQLAFTTQAFVALLRRALYDDQVSVVAELGTTQAAEYLRVADLMEWAHTQNGTVHIDLYPSGEYGLEDDDADDDGFGANGQGELPF